MSEQAIETEDEVITNEEVSTETTEETTEEVEIIIEGEDEPASKAQRPRGLQKRFNKLNGKINAANSQADEANRRADMIEEENKLLRAQIDTPKPTSRPDEDDFDTRVEYLTALDGYDNDRIARATQEQVAQALQNNQTQTTQASHNAQLEESITDHYNRADSLKMGKYEELEDKAIEVLGNDLSKIIMSNTDKSHLIMAHLGANPVKAEELAELVKVNPVKALVKAVEIGNSLSVKTKNTPPDPETKVDSGVAVSDWQRRIDLARDKAADSGNMSDLIALKRQAKDAGIKIR